MEFFNYWKIYKNYQEPGKKDLSFLPAISNPYGFDEPSVKKTAKNI